MKAAEYNCKVKSAGAFVTTNSICQGQQVKFLWPLMYRTDNQIVFAFTSFKWSNLASHNAGVTVVLVGFDTIDRKSRIIYETANENVIAREVPFINAYLTASKNIIVQKSMEPLTEVAAMDFGNKADDGGHLTFSREALDRLKLSSTEREKFVRRFVGSSEFINGQDRYCLWIADRVLTEAMAVAAIADQVEKVRQARLASPDRYAKKLAERSHQFKSPRYADKLVIVTPRVSSENRPYLPVGLLDNRSIVGDRNFALYDAPLWNLALIA
jgi:hypothetical protein